MSFRRGKWIFAALVALVLLTGPSATPRARAIPVATNDTAYKLLGRVFPDPQACTKGTPGNSPWAKGNVCATQFLQWNETLTGLRYLQGKYPRFGHLENLHDLKATVPEFAKLDMQSAGLPQADESRARRDLYAFVVTDDQSPVPLAERHRYAFSLSIHGIERAGLEGGVRAAEDLITWAATAPNTHILEPTNSGPTAGEVLRNSVIYFVLSNPDGWGRGEVSKGGLYFQRYNGNGADVNRDFPGVGYANPVYTPESEPEQQGYAAYLRRERELAGRPFTGGGDLHGMAAADSFSFTLLSGTAESWAENTRVVDTAEAIYSDAIKRLSYSPLIGDPKNCPGNIPVFIVVSEGSAPMCPDQWGTVWDTIDYQTTGSFGDWMASDIGLGATAVDNEMAYSHVVPNDVFVPAIEQLHVDGNKGIIYAQLAALSNPQAPTTRLAPDVAYAPSVQRRVRVATGPAVATTPLRAQADLAVRELAGQGAEFDVKGPADGAANGGLSAEFTFTNVDGISPETMSDVRLERYGVDHPGDAEGWHEVGSWYRQELTYMPAGARIDINDPLPGRYRLAPAPLRHGITTVRVHFSPTKAVPQPNLAYDVANTDVFDHLSEKPRAITPAAVLANAHALDGVSVYTLADDPAPGVAAKDRAAWFAALKTFTSKGGTLVLTDHALDALVDLGVVPASALVKGVEYGGWISFTDEKGASSFGTRLAYGLDRPGASNGTGAGFERRRQTYDPGAVGYPIAATPGPDCTFGESCHAPQEMVNVDAWRKAGGSVVGQTAVVVKRNTGNEPTGVAYGEVPFGAGRIRIAGGLLPTPTEAYNHPYGLEGYALSWTGWQVLANLLSVGDVARAGTNVLAVSEIPRTGADARLPLDVAAIVVTLAALVRFGRAHRRFHALS
jgi:hypothetical protein